MIYLSFGSDEPSRREGLKIDYKRASNYKRLCCQASKGRTDPVSYDSIPLDQHSSLKEVYNSNMKYKKLKQPRYVDAPVRGIVIC